MDGASAARRDRRATRVRAAAPSAQRHGRCSRAQCQLGSRRGKLLNVGADPMWFDSGKNGDEGRALAGAIREGFEPYAVAKSRSHMAGRA